ncbi:hypothetical protein SEA_CAMERICO_16 [Gordonia phage Camerico]|nr:hypothetical protein SEA_CAMERICO_16 [Gordonia phage Camerico]
MADNSVVRPPGAVVQGRPSPVVSPGNTKPANVGGGPYKIGPSESLSKNDKAPEEVFNDEATGYVGVDPQYMNAANATDKPIVEEEEEPEEDPTP